MATKTVTDQSFASDVLGSDSPVLVDFWAEWCGPCRMIAPALEEIAGELGDQVTIAKLNIDENPDTPGRYGVRGIPTMLLFKGGQPVAQKVGAAPRSQIQQWLEANSSGGSVPSRPSVSGRNRSCLGKSSPGLNHGTLLDQKMWNSGAIVPGSSSVTMLKSSVSG
jgi:thioredoxin 1